MRNKINLKDNLYNIYRPQTFYEVRGQKPVVSSLQGLINNNKVPHTMIFTGDSGVGKTTIARIVAKELGVVGVNLIEIDAAMCGGADEIRQTLDALKVTGFNNAIKLIIFDEPQLLSKAAFNAMLKTLEEPPAHLYFALCTTELNKIPKAIQTRSTVFNLKPLKASEIRELLAEVCEEEDLDISDNIINIISQECLGSPRDALSKLSLISEVGDEEEQLILLDGNTENPELIKFVKDLIYDSKKDFKHFIKMIPEIGDSAENVRIVLINYASAALLRETSHSRIEHLLDILDEFKSPFNATDKYAPLLLAIANIVGTGKKEKA